MKRIVKVLLNIMLLLGIFGCTAGKEEEMENKQKDYAPRQSYELNSVHAVKGRQGICTDGKYYWVSGSTTLTKYDRE